MGKRKTTDTRSVLPRETPNLPPSSSREPQRKQLRNNSKWRSRQHRRKTLRKATARNQQRPSQKKMEPERLRIQEKRHRPRQRKHQRRSMSPWNSTLTTTSCQLASRRRSSSTSKRTE